MKSFVYLSVFALIFTLSSFTIQDAYAAADANSITLDATGTAKLKKAVTGTHTFGKGTYDITVQITADIDSVNAKGIPKLSHIAGTFAIDGSDSYDAEFTNLKLTVDKKLKMIKWSAKEGSGQFKFLDALDFTEQTDQEGTKGTIKIKVGKASFAPKVSASSINIANTDDTEAPIVWSPKTTWNWQLTGNFNLSSAIQVFDIDLFDTDISTVNEIHAQGSKAICYISVGSWEDFRPDKDDFPSSVLGNVYAGYPDEKWLDIRALDDIGPIIEKRLDMCKDKGFDAVEPDNIDGYQNETGFPLTYQDQIDFNIWLANEAHERSLLIGLKNDPDQASDLHSYFDWALTEDCYVDGWCEDMSIFINEGKAVFQTEYTDMGVTTDDFCPQSKTLQFSGILKDRDLDAAFTACN